MSNPVIDFVTKMNNVLVAKVIGRQYDFDGYEHYIKDENTITSVAFVQDAIDKTLESLATLTHKDTEGE